MNDVKQLPTGTVTMVFTDIEGSTALLSRLGRAYIHALDAMRATLRSAWSAHGGVEMGTEGDSFFVVFQSAPQAIAAVVRAQRDLGSLDWPDGDDLTVRIGVHSGTPMVHAESYAGMDVHRAARIAAAAHGGQTVLSAAVKELVALDLPEGSDLVDLGHHQLKDIALPEHLYQVVGAGLRSEFPPLRTLGTSSNLPSAQLRMVGRDGELAELTALVSATDVRVVSLTGPGGSGKTRLSIGLAERLADQSTGFPNGVYFVPLVEVTAADAAWAKLADVLNLPPAARTKPMVLDFLADRQALLVLDNLEQFDDAGLLVMDLLDAAPRVTVVASSRHPLHVQAEHEHPVPPLRLPTDAGRESAAMSGAVQMFVQYAQLVRPGLQLDDENCGDIAAICQRLDGLPLALKLAAARCKVLSPKALLARIGSALDIAAPGSYAPERHRTLRATIDWSYQLLDERQQRLFRELGVFAGGADLDAVAAVTAAGGDADPLDTVSELVDASLLTVTESADAEPRVGMLETIREYARDKLVEHGELEVMRSAHAHHYADVLDELEQLWITDAFAVVQVRFDVELDNVREALAYATTQPAQGSDPARRELALRLASGARRFLNDAREVHDWLTAAVAVAGDAETEQHALALAGLANATFRATDYAVAERQAREAAAMAQRVGSDRAWCFAMRTAATCRIMVGDAEAARKMLLEALEVAAASGDLVNIAHLNDSLGFVADGEGDCQQAMEYHAKAYDAAAAAGYSYGMEGFTQNMAAELRHLGRADEAKERLDSILRVAVSIGEVEGMITLAEDYASVLSELGRFREAVLLYGAADAARTELHRPMDAAQEADRAGPMAATRQGLTEDAWAATYTEGGGTRIDQALLAHAPAAS